MESLDNMVLLSGVAARPLTERIIYHLTESSDTNKKEWKLDNINVVEFADGEIVPKIKESVNGKTVYYIQCPRPRSSDEPCNIHRDLWEALLTHDALVQASAASIIDIIPYMPYARQDRVERDRESGSIRVAYNTLASTAQGLMRKIIHFDIHNKATLQLVRQAISIDIAPFFALYARNSEELLGAPEIKAIKNDRQREAYIRRKFMTMSADDGAVKRSHDFADMIGTAFGICHKRHDQGGRSVVTSVTGNVKGKIAIVPEDMLSTGSTILAVNGALCDRGALGVYFMVGHYIGCPREDSQKPIEKEFAEQGIKIVTTDTNPKSMEYMRKHRNICRWMSVSKCLAEFIQKDYERKSLHSFFESFPEKVLKGTVNLNNYLIRP